MAVRRLARELQDCMRNPSQYFRVWPKDETFLVWEGVIHNLPDERHVGKQYSLNINFQLDHPFKPPTIRFIDRVKCENILRNGYVCMDILSDQWSPAFTVSALMHCVTSLLTDAPITGLDNKDIETYINDMQKKRNTYQLVGENVVLNQELHKINRRRRRTEVEMLAL